MGLVGSTAVVGRIAVWVALLAGLAAAARGFRGRSGARGLLGLAAVGGTVATTLLGRALLTNDFSWAYVADVSRRGASGPYRLAALWGGMAGSLLWFSTLIGIVGWFAASRVAPRASTATSTADGADLVRRTVRATSPLDPVAALVGRTGQATGPATSAPDAVRRTASTVSAHDAEGWPFLAWARGVVAAVAGLLVAALAGLVLAFADPFEQLDLPAVDGAGLTPILEHSAMLYHPPLLYLGLASLTAPFALTVALLLARPSPDGPAAARTANDAGTDGKAGDTDPGSGVAAAELAAQVRRWLLVPWTVLAVGMVAGAHWAYVELGWGGYWAWDPVENTAMLPFLAVTLALHASLPRRSVGPTRSLSSGGVSGLVGMAFLLALTGTMLTRSGAVPSVHAFGEDAAIGRGLAALVGVTAVGIGWLLWRARDRPARPTRPGDHPEPSRNDGVSGSGQTRGGATASTSTALWTGRLVVAHLALVGSVLAITVVGTLTPLATELAGGDDVAVEGHYFASFTGPLAAVALAFVALVPFRRSIAASTATNGRRNRRTGATSVAAAWRGAAVVVGGVALGVGALNAGGGDVDLARLLLGGAAGAALVASGGGVASALVRRTRSRPDGKNGRGEDRLAGHLAHAGLGVLLLGVAGTATGATERVAVRPGDTVEILGETLEYRGVSVDEEPDGAGSRAVVADIRAAGRDLAPALVAYPERQVLLAETSLVSTPGRDVQVALRDARDNGTAVLEVGVHPLQVWVWWGALIIVTAGVVGIVTSKIGRSGSDQVAARAVVLVDAGADAATVEPASPRR